MLNRRTFLKSSSLLALAPTVPVFVTRTARAAETAKDSRVLVVVQLDGGNDALNTLVPLKNETYQKLRPRLKIADKDAVKLNDEFGLHPSFRQADKLIKAGHLQAIAGVGYPNPNRSHFESMAIWHTAKTDPEEYKGYGWLGRALDTAGGDSYTITNDVPRALRGRRSAAIALTRLEDLTLADAGTVKNATGPEVQQDLLAFVRRHAMDGTAAADKIAAMTKATDGGAYPNNGVGERLKLIARLLKAGHAGLLHRPGRLRHARHPAVRALEPPVRVRRRRERLLCRPANCQAGRPRDAARVQRIRPYDQGERLGWHGSRHGRGDLPVRPEGESRRGRHAAKPDRVGEGRAQDDDRLPPRLRDGLERLARRQGRRAGRKL
jgi:uncharacterized protein (DUF1501 family)